MQRRTQILSWVAVAAKSTKLLAVFKSLKVFKVLLSLATALVSVLVYGLSFGIWFGVALVGMLFIHEMGHVIALRIKRLPSSLPVFIPFLGAAIFAPNMGDRDTEAYVGYGGPLLGSIAAIVCFGIWIATNQSSDLLLISSYLGVYINLFNMIPISPLDGGRITQAVGGWFKYAGGLLAIALVIISGQPGMLLLLVLILDGFELPRPGRSLLAGTLTVGMVTLMLMGYDKEPVFWADLFDTAFSVLLTMSYISRDRRVQPLGADVSTGRPMPVPRIRVRWLGAYLGLTAVLCGTLVVQTRYLPKHIHHPATQDTP